MARGTLQMAWINKGDGAEEHYHVMYGLDGENKTTKARTVRGKATLKTFLKIDLRMNEAKVGSALGELESRGSVNLEGLDVEMSDLKRMDLA